MIAWIDLETTGLDPSRCGIIEIACIITDNKLNYVAEYQSLVVPIGPMYWEKGATDMHVASGLTEVWLNTHTKPYEKVDKELLDVLMSLHDGQKFYPGGSSVHFDVDFMKAYLPKSASVLSHRMFDVSAVKLLFAAGSVENPSELPPIKSETTHRAMDDIKDSLAAANSYAAFVKENWK